MRGGGDGKGLLTTSSSASTASPSLSHSRRRLCPVREADEWSGISALDEEGVAGKGASIDVVDVGGSLILRWVGVPGFVLSLAGTGAARRRAEIPWGFAIIGGIKGGRGVHSVDRTDECRVGVVVGVEFEFPERERTLDATSSS